MTSIPPPAPRWRLTEEDFSLFLNHLHTDREQAGLAYEALRLKLSYFFEARRCPMPELLVDETINRLIQKISAGEQILNLNAYAFKIAKYVYLESQRGAITVSVEDSPLEDLKTVLKAEALRQERQDELARLDCMRKCLAKLPESARNLLIEYYESAGREQTRRRQQMAARLGLSPNALYIQVHRLREKLEECLANCLKKA